MLIFLYMLGVGLSLLKHRGEFERVQDFARILATAPEARHSYLLAGTPVSGAFGIGFAAGEQPSASGV